MQIDPGIVLDEARVAFENKEYSLALEKYHWFFDNAKKIKKSYSGVRLSYCLSEWAQLGEVYAEAKESLSKLQKSTLINFIKTLSWYSFQEYCSISRYLGRFEEVFEQFMIVKKRDEELAKLLFPLVYNYCADEKMWELCVEYIGNGIHEYNNELKSFSYRLAHINQRFKDDDLFAKQAIESTENKILCLLNILHHTNNQDEYNFLLNKIESDLKDKGHDNMYESICKNLPNK